MALAKPMREKDPGIDNDGGFINYWCFARAVINVSKKYLESGDKEGFLKMAEEQKETNRMYRLGMKIINERKMNDRVK